MKFLLLRPVLLLLLLVIPVLARPPVVENERLVTPSATFDIKASYAFEAERVGWFTVIRTGGTDVLATVDYMTMDGTAKAGTDYSAEKGTLVFGVGEVQKRVGIPITPNGILDDPFLARSFAIVLTNTSNGFTLGASSASVSIVDQEIPPAVDLDFNPDVTVPFAGCPTPFAVCQLDGSLIVGSATLQRIRADGSIDTSFLRAAGQDIQLCGVDFLAGANGSIIAMGGSPSERGLPQRKFVRFGADGRVENVKIFSTNLLPGRIVCFQTNQALLIGDGRLIRLTSDFEPDSTFNAAIPGSPDNAAVLPNGKIVVSYFSFGAHETTLVRLHGDGSLDPAFSPFTTTNIEFFNLIVASGSRIYVGGTFVETRDGGELTRATLRVLREDGRMDQTFHLDDSLSGEVYLSPLATMPDGKLYVQVGSPALLPGIFRLGIDGQIDQSFFPVISAYKSDGLLQGLPTCGVYTIAVRPDGALYFIRAAVAKAEPTETFRQWAVPVFPEQYSARSHLLARIFERPAELDFTRRAPCRRRFRAV